MNCVRIGNPAELHLDDQERGFVIASGQTVSDRLAHTIRQQHTGIISEHGVSDRRLHADTGGTARDDEVLAPSCLQDSVEVGLIEAAIAVLVEDHIAGLRRKFGEDLSVPGVADQNATFRPVGA